MPSNPGLGSMAARSPEWSPSQPRQPRRSGSRSPELRSGKEPRVVCKWLRRTDPDSSEIRMVGIQQPVGLRGCQRRRHHQNRIAPPTREAIADRGKPRRRRCLTPGGRQAAWVDMHTRHVVRHVRDRHHQVRWRIVPIEMNKVLDHRQRQMLRRVGETNTWTGPAAAVAVRALAVERSLRVALPEDSIDPGQLTPPKAIRPRTFSTARAPISVSMTASGAWPPSARFGRLSHRVAASRPPSDDFASATIRARR